MPLLNNIPVLQIPLQKLDNKLDMSRFIIDVLCLIKGISLSKNELIALSYFMTEGYTDVIKEQLITTKLTKNKNSLANILTSLRKHGIIVKEKSFPFNESLAPAFRFQIPETLKIQITLDRT